MPKMSKKMKQYYKNINFEIKKTRKNKHHSKRRKTLKQRYMTKSKEHKLLKQYVDNLHKQHIENKKKRDLRNTAALLYKFYQNPDNHYT